MEPGPLHFQASGIWGMPAAARVVLGRMGQGAVVSTIRRPSQVGVRAEGRERVPAGSDQASTGRKEGRDGGKKAGGKEERRMEGERRKGGEGASREWRRPVETLLDLRS